MTSAQDKIDYKSWHGLRERSDLPAGCNGRAARTGGRRNTQRGREFRVTSRLRTHQGAGSRGVLGQRCPLPVPSYRIRRMDGAKPCPHLTGPSLRAQKSCLGRLCTLPGSQGGGEHRLRGKQLCTEQPARPCWQQGRLNPPSHLPAEVPSLLAFS